MYFNKKNCIGIGLVLMITLFAAVRDSNPSSDEADSETLTIGFLGDVTGPVGFWNAPRIVGIQDAIDYMNSEFGGIGGRKLRLEWRDHKSNTGLADKYYRELKSVTGPVWHSCGSGEQQMLKPQYEKDKEKILFTCSPTPGVIYPVGHVFGTAPYYPDQFGAFIDWLVKSSKDDPSGRMPKIAILTYDSGYGKACISPESLEYAEKNHIEIVDIIYIPFVTKDAVGPLVMAKSKGADWLYGQWLWQSIPPYMKANREYQFGLKFCVNSFGADQVIISNSGDASEGLTGVSSWYMPDDNTEGIRLVKKILSEKSRRPEDQGASYYLGWMNMWQTKMVIEQTLARTHSWNSINPEELIKTLETWDDADIRGLGRVSYSQTRRAPQTIRIVQVRNGKWVPITDWIEAPNLAPSVWRKPMAVPEQRK